MPGAPWRLIVPTSTETETETLGAASTGACPRRRCRRRPFRTSFRHCPERTTSLGPTQISPAPIETGHWAQLGNWGLGLKVVEGHKLANLSGLVERRAPHGRKSWNIYIYDYICHFDVLSLDRKASCCCNCMLPS